MESQNRLSGTVQGLLRCPVCHAKLRLADEDFACANSECNHAFPIVNGIPVLLNEQTSVFSNDDFVSHRDTFFNTAPQNPLLKTIRRFLPTIDNNIKGKSNYSRLSSLLLGQSAAPRVLVIGGSVQGLGMESLAGNTSLELVASDVSFGPCTQLICDAHEIPFEDGSFDGVIAQAVLEHVADPYRCSEEIHRVLKARGVVYSEIPFMQQVHGGRYDFTRFTHLGHRRLFRKFKEIDSGAVCGPGMALAWAYQYFLLSFTTTRALRSLVRLFTRLTSFYLKYVDYYLIDTPATLDAASGYYFMGRKSEQVLTDQELIKLYKGANP